MWYRGKLSECLTFYSRYLISLFVRIYGVCDLCVFDGRLACSASIPTFFSDLSSWLQRLESWKTMLPRPLVAKAPEAIYLPLCIAHSSHFCKLDLFTSALHAYTEQALSWTTCLSHLILASCLHSSGPHPPYTHQEGSLWGGECFPNTNQPIRVHAPTSFSVG